MKSLLTITILFLFSVTSCPSQGCEPTAREIVEIARRDRAIEEKYVSDLFRRSDHVVVGVVSDVRSANDPNYSQIAEIQVEQVFKGKRTRFVTALMHKNVESTVPSSEEEEVMTAIVSCDQPLDPAADEPYIIEGARALFYVDNGILMRVNPFPTEPQLMRFDVKLELRFLKSQAPE
jgi:hypothetical protein